MKKIKHNISAFPLILLTISPAFTTAVSEQVNPKMSENNGWKIVKTDIATLMFPDGS